MGFSLLWRSVMGRSMFSQDITGTDAFLDLPEGSQLLYYRLGYEGSYGRINGIRRIARGYGCTPEDLQALYDAGYLFDHGDECWVRHYWVNNSFKSPNNKHAKDMPEIVSGEIGFEGEEFKSAFVLHDKPSISLDEGSTYSYSDSYSDSPTYSYSDSPSDSYSDSPSDSLTGSCICPRCNGKARYRETGGEVVIICPSCGDFVNRRAGGS